MFQQYIYQSYTVNLGKLQRPNRGWFSKRTPPKKCHENFRFGKFIAIYKKFVSNIFWVPFTQALLYMSPSHITSKWLGLSSVIPRAWCLHGTPGRHPPVGKVTRELSHKWGWPTASRNGHEFWSLPSSHPQRSATTLKTFNICFQKYQSPINVSKTDHFFKP